MKAEYFKSHHKTNIATYLRGIAALGVIVIHWNGLGTRDVFIEGSAPDVTLEKWVDLGAYGPIIFFLASGFSLASSLSKKRYTFFNFATRRFFRLIPMLAVSLITVSIFSGSFNVDFFGKEVLFKILLVDAFSPSHYYYDPIGVLWTIPVEFWWSLTIPIFLKLIAPNRMFILIPLIICMVFLAIYGDSFWSNFVYAKEFDGKFIFNYGIYFLLGVISYKVRVRLNLQRNYNKYLFFSILLAIYSKELGFNELYLLTFLSVAFLMFYAEPARSKPLFKKPLLFLGNICYSTYLLHIPVAEYSRNLLGVTWYESLIRTAFLVFICSLTYRYIEVPFIKLSDRLISVLSSRSH